MATLNTHCQLYGESLYTGLIYTEPCRYTGDVYHDFIFNINELRPPYNGVDGYNWALYRRDINISTVGPINDTHIRVDSGITNDNFIRISLIDYGLRATETDYLLVTQMDSQIGHRAYSYIKYYPNGYTSLDTNPPYHQVSLYLARETVSGGMGGSVVTHTEYKEKPLPKIRVVEIEEPIIDKEIRVIDIKDFD